jgi:hypothetical protein
LLLTALLVWVFWVEASDRLDWDDAALALASAVLCVLAISIARRSEKAAWIMQPTWKAKLLVALGTLVLIFGAIYADAYFLHRKELTPARFRQDMIIDVIMLVAAFSPLRRRNTARRQVP